MAIKYKVFTPDKNNKVSFTKQELENLLTEVYNEGYRDSQLSTWYVNYGITPSINPILDKVTCNGPSVTGKPSKDDITFTTATTNPMDAGTCLYNSSTSTIYKTKE